MIMWGWDVCDMLSGCEGRDTGAARPDPISQSGASMSRQWTNQRRAPGPGLLAWELGLHSRSVDNGRLLQQVEYLWPRRLQQGPRDRRGQYQDRGHAQAVQTTAQGELQQWTREGQ